MNARACLLSTALLIPELAGAAEGAAIVAGAQGGAVELVNGLSLKQQGGAVVVGFPGGKTRTLEGVGLSVDAEKVTLSRPVAGIPDKPDIRWEHTFLRTETQDIYRNLRDRSGILIATRMHVNFTRPPDDIPFYTTDLFVGPTGAWKEHYLERAERHPEEGDALKLKPTFAGDGSYTWSDSGARWAPIIPADWILQSKAALEAGAGVGSPNPAPSARKAEQLKDAEKAIRKVDPAALQR